MLKHSSIPSIPIVNYISDFLHYCQNKGLSPKTQENYERFLKKFFIWLKENNLENLKPHELTSQHIWDYRLYLSRHIDPKTHKSLKKTTQNYYLIALRALLSCFSAKDVVCIPSDKIALPRADKREKTVKFLNLEQIERFLSLPDIKKESGLRDKVILEILCSTGIKIARLVSLNKNQINTEQKLDNIFSPVYLSEKVLFWVKKYLKKRKDDNKALFINYRSRKQADNRLTNRSVERMTNYYGKKLNLPCPLTPESLRWAYFSALINNQKNKEKLTGVYKHNYFNIDKYQIEKQTKNYESLREPFFWSDVENLIVQEIDWLENNIDILPKAYRQEFPFLGCDECIFRKIAILIVSGKVKAAEFNSLNGKNLWNNNLEEIIIPDKIYHGKEWHKKMLIAVTKYFEQNRHKIYPEPIMNLGRADLGIKSNGITYYIEIGTVSLFKILINLLIMKNAKILVIPSENKIIEFKI